jgi:hypothetical protein
MNKHSPHPLKQTHPSNQSSAADKQSTEAPEKLEITELNGPKGPEPTRFGDWERKGRCIDF